MKILLLGDASNYHHNLSLGLARLGHDVTVASHGSRWMGTGRDIDLSRRPGKLGGLWLWLKLSTLLASDLKGYDVVQISNPIFLDLRPARVRAVFDRLRRNNGSVFLTALGTDTPYVGMCCAPDSPLRYNEWRVGDRPTPYALSHEQVRADWMSPLLSDHCRYVYDCIDGAVSALYEYHLSIARCLPSDKIAYGGIPIAADAATAARREAGPLRVMVACHKGREAEKGIDVMLPQIQAAAAACPGLIEVDMVQNVPLRQFEAMLSRADVVVDQLYSYTPATTALMAMARGKLVISGAEPEYYRFIGETAMQPIINADPEQPEALARQLCALAANPALLADKAAQAPAFVEKHNGLLPVANRFVDFWKRRMP